MHHSKETNNERVIGNAVTSLNVLENLQSMKQIKMAPNDSDTILGSRSIEIIRARSVLWSSMTRF